MLYILLLMNLVRMLNVHRWTASPMPLGGHKPKL